MREMKPTFQSEESRRVGLLVDEATRNERVMEWASEDHSKLLILCQHFGIQTCPTMFYQLAPALAHELYPEPVKRGRKSKWKTLNKGALVVEVERIMKPDDPTHGVQWACTQVAKHEPWASFLKTKGSNSFGPDPAEALRQIYFDFRGDKWANIFRDAFKMYEHEGKISEWEKLVSDLVINSHPK